MLVIDDNHLNRALLRTVLQSEGYDVLEAANAADGLDAARRLRPDLIVLDLKLPDMSGFNASRILKSDPVTQSIPVVITSALGTDADQKHLRECGWDRYIPAPINVSSFADLIRSFLQPGWLRR